MGTLRSILAALLVITIPSLASAESASGKHNRLKRILNQQMGMPSGALTEMSSFLDDVWWYDTRANLAADSSRTEGTLGCAEDTNSCYAWMGSEWLPLDPRTPEFTVNFTEGANKAIQLMRATGVAYVSTAAVLNYIYYGKHIFGFMPIVDAGDTVPAADATGLDITAGNVTNNDNEEIFTGTLGTTGRPFIVGTDPAFKFCATMSVADVSGSDLMACGFRTPDPATVAIASYTDYCAVGHASGNYFTHDKTNGLDDSASDVIADTESDVWCTLVSAAGVCTYTVDGVAVSSPGAHTIPDGLLVIPFCTVLHDADGADDTLITKWDVVYQ